MRRAFVTVIATFLVLGACTEDAFENRTDRLRFALITNEVGPLEETVPATPEKFALGRALFFDPVLSGNRDSSCFTCHSPELGTGDARSLSVGTKAIEVEGKRLPGPRHSFMPRNSRDLYNRNQPSIRSLFWDNRLQALDDGRIVIYDNIDSLAPESFLRIFPDNLDSLLAAQALLPVINRTELRGDFQDTDIFGDINELSRIPDQDFEGVWSAVMYRLMAFHEYRDLFDAAYPGGEDGDRTFFDAANALAAFMGEAFSFDDSPWDQFLAGDDAAMDESAVAGALLFYGKAGCVQCHGGALFSDQELYNVGVRPIDSGPEIYDPVDRGAAHRSNAGPERNFFFRTPPLRNVELSGPWMHNGAYTSLEAVIRHKISPLEGLRNYDGSQIDSEFRPFVHLSEDVVRQVEETLSPELLTVDLADGEVSDLVAFLKALTSPSARDFEGEIPSRVPSGLPIVGP
jgi:cytochrome c peroxidase